MSFCSHFGCAWRREGAWAAGLGTPPLQVGARAGAAGAVTLEPGAAARAADVAARVVSRWPDGRAAAVSLTFDNLGEAAEIELGLRGADEPRGGHWSVVSALPVVMERVVGAGCRLPATFSSRGSMPSLSGGAALDRGGRPRSASTRGAMRTGPG
jgi:hypothetical protein